MNKTFTLSNYHAKIFTNAYLLLANRVESLSIPNDSEFVGMFLRFWKRGGFMLHYCSRVLTSGCSDRLKSSSTSDESTKFGCIGHG